jgi:cytochrome P450
MALFAQPQLLALARSHPEKRRAIIEEGLRWDSPVAVLPRMSPPDRGVDWQGIPLAPGTTLLFAIAAANRDPVAFPDPERFDPDRAYAVPPLTFGFGTHFCVGNHLAFAEIGIGLDVLLDTFAELELVPDAGAEVVGTILRGPNSLPVRCARGRLSATPRPTWRPW